MGRSELLVHPGGEKKRPVAPTEGEMKEYGDDLQKDVQPQSVDRGVTFTTEAAN